MGLIAGSGGGERGMVCAPLFNSRPPSAADCL